MSHVTSKDGTRIAYERLGSGPALLLIDGALCSRAFGPMPKIAALLAEHFTVYLYDRRGRGESGDTQPYAKAREVEDIQALIAAAGGSAYAAGLSSGAALALEAAASGASIKKLAVYEPPFMVDDARHARARSRGQAESARGCRGARRGGQVLHARHGQRAGAVRVDDATHARHCGASSPRSRTRCPTTPRSWATGRSRRRGCLVSRRRRSRCTAARPRRASSARSRSSSRCCRTCGSKCCRDRRTT